MISYHDQCTGEAIAVPEGMFRSAHLRGGETGTWRCFIELVDGSGHKSTLSLGPYPDLAVGAACFTAIVETFTPETEAEMVDPCETNGATTVILHVPTCVDGLANTYALRPDGRYIRAKRLGTRYLDEAKELLLAERVRTDTPMGQLGYLQPTQIPWDCTPIEFPRTEWMP